MHSRSVRVGEGDVDEVLVEQAARHGELVQRQRGAGPARRPQRQRRRALRLRQRPAGARVRPHRQLLGTPGLHAHAHAIIHARTRTHTRTHTQHHTTFYGVRFRLDTL